MSGLITPDALVFDLDGTLWDAAVPTACGWNRALEHLGVDTRVTVEGIRSVAGTPFAGCVQILVPELGARTRDVLGEIDAGQKQAMLESAGELFPGVEGGLRALAKQYPLFLVSNCQDWYLELFLDTSGLRECFTGSDCNGCSGLPKDGMLRHLSQEHELTRAVYVGDTAGDREASVAAGMEFAFAGYGFGSVSEPVLAFGSFDELREYYAGIGGAETEVTSVRGPATSGSIGG